MNFVKSQQIVIWTDACGQVILWKHRHNDKVSKPIRVFRNSLNKPYQYAMISMGSPLYIVLYCQQNSTLELVTMDGEPIMKEQIEDGMINPKVIQCLNCNNFIAQGNMRGQFQLRCLPNITRIARFMIYKELPIIRFNLSEDSKQIFACGVSGKMNILTESNL